MKNPVLVNANGFKQFAFTKTGFFSLKVYQELIFG